MAKCGGSRGNRFSITEVLQKLKNNSESGDLDLYSSDYSDKMKLKVLFCDLFLVVYQVRFSSNLAYCFVHICQISVREIWCMSGQISFKLSILFRTHVLNKCVKFGVCRPSIREINAIYM